MDRIKKIIRLVCTIIVVAIVLFYVGLFITR